MAEPQKSSDPTPPPGSMKGPRDVLASIQSNLEALNVKVDAHRKEGAKRGEEHASNIDTVRSDLETLKGRVMALENKPPPIAVTPPEVTHGMRKMQSYQSANERVNRGICAALGIDYDALSAPLTDTLAARKFEAVVSRPKGTLSKISTQQKMGWVGSALTIIIILLQLLLQHR